ncbi:hypothetical protein MTR67_021471 [Solanum verrucosum]|uniref:F-box domain-containing protein n=1 Tax=Solanum verrucosum TaxID=315347 RepID=A0AAF0TPZ3_SOLVR|nr:hypothetical protein MTR67_021471 [Solanum verrucosum]
MCPLPNGFKHNLRLKTRWFTGLFNSHQVLHFTAFFIDARADCREWFVFQEQYTSPNTRRTGPEGRAVNFSIPWRFPHLVLIGDNCAIYMMLPNDKKLCSATLPSDVLSNLPENVLDDILIRMPLRDVVRTSILSKKWRYNWCRLPELTLDQTLWDSTNESIPFVTRFTDIIYHLLVLHVGPITKLILSDIANLGNYSKIDNLVMFLSRNGDIHILSLGKAPFLVKLSLVNTAATLKAGKHISKYFEFCPALEHLHLDYSSLQIDYVALNKLLLPVPDDVANEIPSSFSDVTLNHLRSVKFEVITGKKTEMELVKLLLAKSPMLVRMLIQPDRVNGSAETRLKVVTEITKFPRASPKAEVYYNSGV